MAWRIASENQSEPIAQQNNSPQVETPEQQPQDKEGWGEYIKRNLAAIPEELLTQVLSGVFGVGDLRKNIVRGIGYLAGGDTKDFNKKWKEYEQESPLWPKTSEYAREKVRENILPESLKTEEKPQDWLPRLLSRELIPAAASGGLSSIPALGNYAISSAGAHLGGYGGQKAAEKLGGGEGAQFLGGLAGSLAGGAATHAARQFGAKKLRKVELQKKRFKFESEKTNKLAEFIKEETHHNENALKSALQEHHDEIKDINKTYDQHLQDIDSKIQNRANEIEQLGESRNPLYEKAKSLEGDHTLDATKIQSAIDKVNDMLSHGASEAQVNAIAKPLNDLSSRITVDPNTGKATIPLENAKIFKQVIGNEAWTRSLPENTKNAFKHLTHELGEVIKTAHPEHESVFRPAEETTVKYKNEKKEFNDYKSRVLKERSKIEQERRSQISEAKKKFNEKKKEIKSKSEEYKGQKEKLHDTKFEDLIAAERKVENIQNNMDAAISGIKSSNSGLGLAAIGYALFGKKGALAGKAVSVVGNYAKKQINEVARILKDNPDIRKKAAQATIYATAKDTPAFLNKVIELDKALKIKESKKKLKKHRMGSAREKYESQFLKSIGY